MHGWYGSCPDRAGCLPLIHFVLVIRAAVVNLSHGRRRFRLAFSVLHAVRGDLIGDLVVVESIKIKVGHQVGLYIINRFAEGFDEFVEILFVEKDFVTVIPIIVKPLAALCNGQVIIIPFGSPYIKKVGPPFPGADTFAVNALHFLVIVLVRHCVRF